MLHLFRRSLPSEGLPAAPTLPSQAPQAAADTAVRRRRFVGTALGGLGAAGLLGACGGGSTEDSASTGSAGGTTIDTGSNTSATTATDTTSGTSTGTTTGSTTGTTTASTLSASQESTLAALLDNASVCTVVAQEGEGPYPLRAILSNAAMVRRDITESHAGVPLMLRIRVTDVARSCAAVQGAWVYIWHCDQDGLYSGYSASNNAGQSGLTYCRGIQATNAAGEVTFQTIYPGWYAGRITHIHCMVFLAGSTLSASSASLATTQFAFPTAVTRTVYASSRYTKGQNTSVTSFAADNVFSDGTATELLTVSGSVTDGYFAGISVGITGA